jgi:hypothetical protein
MRNTGVVYRAASGFPNPQPVGILRVLRGNFRAPCTYVCRSFRIAGLARAGLERADTGIVTRYDGGQRIHPKHLEQAAR